MAALQEREVAVVAETRSRKILIDIAAQTAHARPVRNAVETVPDDEIDQRLMATEIVGREDRRYRAGQVDVLEDGAWVDRKHHVCL
jgi:hypothetical protein